MSRLGALIPRRHLASLVVGDNRHGLQIVGKRRLAFLVGDGRSCGVTALRWITIE
jgi:hypothetical protein